MVSIFPGEKFCRFNVGGPDEPEICPNKVSLSLTICESIVKRL
jgi:hypothetical protein